MKFDYPLPFIATIFTLALSQLLDGTIVQIARFVRGILSRLQVSGRMP